MNMKKYIISILAFAACLFLASCQKEELSEQSVITVDQVDYTPFDNWLEANFVKPYNIQFKYRYDVNEADFNYYTIPAGYDQSIEMAHLVKYLCIEAYDECAGINFTRQYFPKLFFLIGEWEYRNNGTIILGTAEGGRKILLSGLNYLDKYKTDSYNLNHYYIKTIHHEFTHILNQTREMPVDFQFISGNGYVADMWSKSPYDTRYLGRGFISEYSQHSYTEDFAEMFSMFLCNSEAQWNIWMAQADKEAALIAEETGEPLVNASQIIGAKLDLVRKYMEETFNVDIYELRESIQRRQADVVAGKIDLYDIALN